jgi:hypothetical protein
MGLVQNEIYNKEFHFWPTNLEQSLMQNGWSKFQFIASELKCNGTCHKSNSNTNAPQQMGPQTHQKDNTNLWVPSLGTSLQQRPKKLIYGPTSPQEYNKRPNTCMGHKPTKPIARVPRQVSKTLQHKS